MSHEIGYKLSIAAGNPLDYIKALIPLLERRQEIASALVSGKTKGDIRESLENNLVYINEQIRLILGL